MSEAERRILIGSAGGEQLVIEWPEIAGEWARVDVSFRSGAFAGAFRCNVLAAELHELERMLPVVKRDLVAYSWWSAERNIALELIPSRLGTITVSVELSDDPALRKLSFDMAIDQSYLPG